MLWASAGGALPATASGLDLALLLLIKLTYTLIEEPFVVAYIHPREVASLQPNTPNSNPNLNPNPIGSRSVVPASLLLSGFGRQRVCLGSNMRRG